MPCNGDYLNPTQLERETRRAAKLFLFVCHELNRTPPKAIIEAANDMYTRDKTVVPLLCGVLSSMRKKDIDRIVYNARSKASRDLANWWEEHQEADRQRIANELAQKEEKEKDKALKKLSKLSLKELKKLAGE